MDARTSIVEHIKRSILNKDHNTENSACRGVSLKYSLDLVTRALDELALCKDDVHELFKDQVKQVQINLVHMNDHSHILSSINDNFVPPKYQKKV